MTNKEAHAKLFDIEVGIANHLYGTPITSGPTTRTYRHTPHQTPQHTPQHTPNLGPIMPLLNGITNEDTFLLNEEIKPQTQTQPQPQRSASFEEFMRGLSAISVESGPYISPQLHPNEKTTYNVPYLLLGQKIATRENCFSDSLSDEGSISSPVEISIS
jgi:hypothetical protein